MPRQQQPSQAPRLSSGAAGGDAGAKRQGPIAGLIAQQQDQQESMSKLIKTMQEAQENNAVAVQQAAQAGGQGATQVANQVAAGIDRQNQEKARTAERSEDQKFAEDRQKLNSELQRDAAKEAASMGAAINGQRTAMINFVDSFKEKKAAHNQAIAAFSARTDEMLSAGWFSSVEGRKELAMRRHHMDAIRISGEDHFSDRHLSEAYRLHNRGVQALIAGDDARDLSNLRVDPLMMPMANPPEQSDKRLMQPGELSGDQAFELKMYGGYPPNGVIFNEEENFGLPEGYSPKFVSSDIILDAVAQDDYLRFANDKSLRQELDRKNAEIIVQARDRLEPHMKQYRSYNKMFNPMAGGAIQRSLEDFLSDENPNKFNDMGRQITFGALKEMFGGGEKGDKIAKIAAEVFDGKRELKTDKELAIAMALESAMFSIKTQMQSEFMNTDADSSLGGNLVKQMEELLGPEQTARALGVPSGAVGFVKGVDAMMGRLAEASAFSSRAHQGFEQNSLIEQFKEAQGKFARMADVMTTRILDEGEQTERRVNELMGLDVALSSGSEAVDAIPPDELEDANTATNSKGLESIMSNMDAAISITKGLGPDSLNELAAMMTQELTPLTTGNFQSYNDQVLVEQQRSGYVANAIDHAGFNHGRQRRAREARLAKGTGTTADSFAEGGGIGVVVDKVPAMLSLGHQGLANTISNLAVGAVAGVAGQPLAEKTAMGSLAALKGRLPIPFPGETARMGNTTLEEKSQLIRESNKGN